MTQSIGTDRQTFIQAAFIRVALIALLWWILTEGDLGYWGLALPIIIATTVASLLLMPAGTWRWSLIPLVRFVPYFLYQTWHGSLDVARRALHPRLPLQPAFIDYRLRLPEGPQRVFLSGILSLLPGTLSVDLRTTELRVHVLDETMPVAANIRNLEGLVADLFGVAIDDT